MKKLIFILACFSTGCTKEMLQNFNCKLQATRTSYYSFDGHLHSLTYTPYGADETCDQAFPASGVAKLPPITPPSFEYHPPAPKPVVKEETQPVVMPSSDQAKNAISPKFKSTLK